MYYLIDYMEGCCSMIRWCCSVGCSCLDLPSTFDRFQRCIWLSINYFRYCKWRFFFFHVVAADDGLNNTSNIMATSKDFQAGLYHFLQSFFNVAMFLIKYPAWLNLSEADFLVFVTLSLKLQTLFDEAIFSKRTSGGKKKTAHITRNAQMKTLS